MNTASYIYRAWTSANDFVNIILSTVHLYLTKKMWKKIQDIQLPVKFLFSYKIQLSLKSWPCIPTFPFFIFLLYIGIQCSSVAQLCPTLCDPMAWRTPGLPVHHQLPEIAQIHVHWVIDCIQPSSPWLSTSPPTFNLSRHQGLFKGVSCSHQVAKVLEFQLQHQSFQWTPRTDLL